LAQGYRDVAVGRGEPWAPRAPWALSHVVININVN